MGRAKMAYNVTNTFKKKDIKNLKLKLNNVAIKEIIKDKIITNKR